MKISIMGCGWLGLPLAERLLKNGHAVKGSTTSPEKLEQLSERGIEPYLIRLTPGFEGDDCDEFLDSEVLILNIPPGRRRDDVVDYHAAQIKNLLERLKSSDVSFVVFVSSTSVYPMQPGIVREDDVVPGEARRASGNALLIAEDLLSQQENIDTTIVRFGGLYGYDRNPAKYLADKKNLDRGMAPVNLIHRDDCVSILEHIVEKDIRGEVLNAVSDGHPPRMMYYTAIAKAAGIEPPTFLDDKDRNYKVVSNKKLKNLLNYQFKYPNPMDI